MVMCFAPTCKHYSEKNLCKFYVFPNEASELKEWLKQMRRVDRELSKHSRICSCHFVNGDRRNGPTIFTFDVREPFENIENKPKKQRMSIVEVEEPQAGPSGLQQMYTGVRPPSLFERVTASPLEEDVRPPPEETATVTPFEADVGYFFSEPSETQTTLMKTEESHSNVVLEAENYFLKQEVDTMKEELHKLSTTFSFRHIEGNDHLICVYTGLPTKQLFLALFSLFENIKLNYFHGWQVVRVPRIDQLLLTLMKLKLNLVNDDLGFRFNISRETVSNIFKTWLFALHEILYKQLMKDMPSREKNKLCMPTSFSSFTNCKVIIDCTEVNMIYPKNMERQRVTYSSYKHGNTLKGLIGVAPNGVITFVSKLYPGSTSDKKITDHCGITQKLVSGDLLLADKGFLISDLLPQGVSMNIPPFLCTPQFTREQVIRTRTIAKARIHVERAIQRIKVYSILHRVPATLIPHASTVFQVCAALTNLHFPLIKEVQKLYDY